jgi:hypothetical protein
VAHEEHRQHPTADTDGNTGREAERRQMEMAGDHRQAIDVPVAEHLTDTQRPEPQGGEEGDISGHHVAPDDGIGLGAEASRDEVHPEQPGRQGHGRPSQTLQRRPGEPEARHDQRDACLQQPERHVRRPHTANGAAHSDRKELVQRAEDSGRDDAEGDAMCHREDPGIEDVPGRQL